jgi:uncharacterized protein YndB with AHSA1/START domain
MDTPFVIEQVYDAQIDKVWHALTTESQLREWYFPQIIKFEPIVGFEFQFVDDGSDFKKDWRVTQVTAGKLLAHSWVYKDYPGKSEVTFELFDQGEKTRLIVTHTGLGSFSNDPHFARHRFVEGWERIIRTDLKKNLEKNL